MLLVDTNIWLSAADRRSDRHRDCIELIADHRGDIGAPIPVIAESAWLILDRLGVSAHEHFLALITSGEVAAIDLTRGDWERCAELCAQYRDLTLDLVDASVVAIAERLGETTIATFNRRGFAVVRPSHVDALTLIP